MALKQDELQVWQTPTYGKVLLDGKLVSPPEGWCFLESGDAGLTRRVKASGEYWVVVRKWKNRIQSVGLWAPENIIWSARQELLAERQTPEYQHKLETGRKYREGKQMEYIEDFRRAVLEFLDFAPRWQFLGEQLADAVVVHATPVGSGTVARTQTIPIEQRAEAAVIAWMRHQTTAYDHMTIARIRGERREVRRHLAAKSRELLQKYRAGEDMDLEKCPLAQALKKISSAPPDKPTPQKVKSLGGKLDNFFLE